MEKVFCQSDKIFKTHVILLVKKYIKEDWLKI